MYDKGKIKLQTLALKCLYPIENKYYGACIIIEKYFMQSVKFEYERVHDNICNNVMPIYIWFPMFILCNCVIQSIVQRMFICLYVLYMMCAVDIYNDVKYLCLFGACYDPWSIIQM